MVKKIYSFFVIFTLWSPLFCEISQVLSSSVFSFSAQRVEKEKKVEQIAFLSEASFSGDFGVFAFQKNRDFFERYCAENNMNGELSLIRFTKELSWIFRGEVKGGYGNSETGLLLDPEEVSFALIPQLEYKFRKFNIVSGLDHRCFHFIDRYPPSPIVYWNRLFLSITSFHKREKLSPFYLQQDTIWNNLYKRFVWSFSTGYYLSEFFGLVDPIKLMPQDYLFYLWESELNIKYGIAKWKNITFLVKTDILLGFKKAKKGNYWSMENGLEILFDRKTFYPVIFIDYFFDRGLFNSKDRLLKFGLRVIR
ncbi:MAG: hypothetical protein N2053_00470 [Chitinispirillaceae bacterium]|nr:hypothetical protein [Chitinispirillaceae bacterium]